MLVLSLAVMVVTTMCGGVAAAVSVVSPTYILLDNRYTMQWNISDATVNVFNATVNASNATMNVSNTTTIAPTTTTIAPNGTTNVSNATTSASNFTTVVFTLQRSGTIGWIGVGFADSGMNGSIVVCHSDGTNSSCGNYNGNDHNPTRKNTTVQWISSWINSTTNRFQTTFRMNTSDFGIKNGTQRMIVAFGNWNDAIDFPLKHAPDTRTPLTVDIFAGIIFDATTEAPSGTPNTTAAAPTTLVP
jgi:hypothetical protein